MKTYVVYHRSCYDGFCAAWVASKSLPVDTEFIPASYGDPVPEFEPGSEIYILDFSYPRDVLVKLAEKVKKLVVLDHHVTAQTNLIDLVEDSNNTAEILLSNGNIAYVDSEDLPLVSDYAWSEAVHGGAVAYTGGGRDNAKNVYMHRLILKPNDSDLIDHINRNPLDNRKGNLRVATKQMNAANMKRSGGLKGITKRGSKWVAQITINGNNNYLGIFDSEKEAATAYDTAAQIAFGDFALGNFIGPKELTPANIKCIFDMEKSGAGLTWDYFHPGEARPALVDYVEDRDLWRFALPHSREVFEWYASYPMDFSTWDEINDQLNLDPVGAFSEGAAIRRHVKQKVEQACKQAVMVELGGHEVPAVNVPYTMGSDVGERLLELYPDAPFSGYWFVKSSGEQQWGLRSRKGAGFFDVSEVAKQYGGGGHATASGFIMGRVTR